MITLSIVASLLLIAGISNSIMDVLSFRYKTSIFYKLNSDWFDPRMSWVLKWKHTNEFGGKMMQIEPNKKHLWYYLWLYRPQYKERFLYSSTILVFLTDAWHFCKWVTFTCYEVSIVLIIFEGHSEHWYYAVITILVFKSVRGATFNPFFNNFWIDKNSKEIL